MLSGRFFERREGFWDRYLIYLLRKSRFEDDLKCKFGCLYLWREEVAFDLVNLETDGLITQGIGIRDCRGQHRCGPGICYRLTSQGKKFLLDIMV